MLVWTTGLTDIDWYMSVSTNRFFGANLAGYFILGDINNLTVISSGIVTGNVIRWGILINDTHALVTFDYNQIILMND